MPINPNIILGIQAPKFQMADPLESAHKSLALQALMGQQDLQGLQIDEARRGAESSQRLRELFGTNPNATPEDVMRIDPVKGLKMRQDLLTNRKTEGEINKTRAETMGKLLGFQKESAGALMVNPTPENAFAAVDQFERMASSFGMPELSQQAAQQRAAIQAAGNNPEALKRLAASWALAADKFLPNFETVNDGKVTRMIDKNYLSNPNAGTQTITMQTTPGQDQADLRARTEGALNRGVTIRGQDMTDARAQQTLAAGKAPAGYRFAADGQSLEAIPGGPADGKADKLGESAKKQITGIDALGTAIDEYTAKLANWSRKDMANPSKRAEMGTLYNNVMLQAKEAYNLGVLNGPDYSILQSVVADPNNPKNILIAPEDLSKQATTLKSLMAKTRESVKNQGRGDGAPSAPITATNAAGQKIQLVNGVWQPVNK